MLAAGDVLCICPEGGITRDGTLQPIQPAVMKILQQRPVPVVPVALHKLWGSYFSRIEGGQAMVRPLRRGLFSAVGVSAGPALAPEALTPEALHAQVQALLQAG